MRITIAVPLALIDAANELARCTGLSEADGLTFTLAPEYQDTQGRIYRVASGLVSDSYPQTIGSPLVEPSWGCDLALASVAQAAIRIGAVADPSHIAAVIGDDPQAAIAAMGLEPVPSDPLA